MVSKAARRYAGALLQVAVEQDRLEAVLGDARMIHQTLESSRELRVFLKSPVIRDEDKKEALLKLFGDKVDPLMVRFLELILEKGRESILEQIFSGFIRDYKKHAGIVDVQVYTAMELSKDLDGKLRDTLGRITGKKVEIEYLQKPELMGGMAVQIEDTVIDGTIKHKIDRLNTLFREAAIGTNRN